MYKNTQTSYGSVSKFLHWLIFLLILIMLCVGFFMDTIPNKALQSNVYNLHKLTGISILALMIFRVIWMFMNPRPALPLDTPRWQKIAEYIVQGSIYLALIAMPIAGWVMTAAEDHLPHLFGFTLALPIAPNKALGDLAGDVHYYLAWVIIGLITIHFLAAMYHYVIKKDQILQRMLP